MDAQVVWRKKGENAETSGDTNIIATEGVQENVQFLYTKTKNDSLAAPFMKVFLKNYETSEEYKIDENFDSITLACSCYWLSAKDQFKDNPSMKSSLQYRIIFRGQDSSKPLEAAVSLCKISICDLSNNADIIVFQILIFLMKLF
jgi:hypothetical protein